MHPAKYFTKAKNNQVICQLCPHYCLIAEKDSGTCKVRRNEKGILFAENYGHITGLAVDPIEKKPLYHYFPGNGVLSIGSLGCNMACSFCQNAHISQNSVSSAYSQKQYTIEEITEMVKAMEQTMLAYTYNEPVVFYEFMLDCACLAKTQGLKNVMVSNAYINEKPLEELLENIDAFNIDLKAFDEEFYKEIAYASLDPVLETIKKIAESGKHLELTFLVIPELNDDVAKFREMIEWIADECGEEQVVHLSRYFPHHNLQKSSTPLEIIEKFTEIARRKLKYVYPGNTGLSFDSNTYCHSCTELLIERSMYKVNVKMEGGKCPQCGIMIPGVFN